MAVPPEPSSRSAGRVFLQTPSEADAAEFTALARRSRRFHAGLVSPPRTLAAYQAYLTRSAEDASEAFLIRRRSDRVLVGAANLSQIFRGPFQNAYLGFWLGAPFAGAGYMTEALRLVLGAAFGGLRLHRLEANVQPANHASRAVLQWLRFRLEGYSPRYLKVGGRWRDHERWAILREEWQGKIVVTPEAERV